MINFMLKRVLGLMIRVGRELSKLTGELFNKTHLSRVNFSMNSMEQVLESEENETPGAAEDEEVGTEQRGGVINRGILSVTVISAENLAATDLMRKADPYVMLTLKKSETRNNTTVVNGCLNPVWNQRFDFVIEDGLHDMLIVQVWDRDTFGKDRMGGCSLTLARAILEGEYKEWFQLDGVKSGKLNLHLKWTPQPIYRDSQAESIE